jgi:hypothetical protein
MQKYIHLYSKRGLILGYIPRVKPEPPTKHDMYSLFEHLMSYCSESIKKTPTNVEPTTFVSVLMIFFFYLL